MAAAAAAGRNVDEDSPGKGRVAKVARTSAAAGGMGPPTTAGSAYLSVCQQVGVCTLPLGRIHKLLCTKGRRINHCCN